MARHAVKLRSTPRSALRRRSGQLVSAAILAHILDATPLLGQEAAPSPSFDEELSVEVINVEVHVTDRKGRPVTGLAREDFRLLEDGDPVEIEYFTEIDATSSAPPSEAPPVKVEADPAAAPAPPARDLRTLVVYLDDATSARPAAGACWPTCARRSPPAPTPPTA